MRILRRQVNEHRDKACPHTEFKRFSRQRIEFLPQRCQLLAIIADFRQSYSTRKLEHSKKLMKSLADLFLKRNSVLAEMTEVQACDLRDRTITVTF
jgi:hypothetical protein